MVAIGTESPPSEYGAECPENPSFSREGRRDPRSRRRYAPEAEAPISHYILSSLAAVNMRRYMMKKLGETAHYTAVRDRHFVTLNNMVLVNLSQAFERFIKDLAAVCVDHLFDRTIDGRFDEPQVRGSSLAAHFAGSSPGKALCESGTWLDYKGNQ